MLSINNNTPLRIAQKLTNQNVVSQTTIQPDTELFVPDLEIGRRYVIRVWWPFFLVGAASGYKFGVTVPGDLAFFTYDIQVRNGSIGAIVNGASFIGTGVLAGALAVSGVTHICEVTGQMEVGPTIATLALGFAQNVSDPAAIISLRSSFLELTDFGG